MTKTARPRVADTGDVTMTLFGEDTPSNQTRTRRLAQAGELRYTRVGKTYWFDLDSVDEWLARFRGPRDVA